mgnify:CR=1 FL=1
MLYLDEPTGVSLTRSSKVRGQKNKCYVYVLHRRTDVVSLKGSSKVRDQIKETSARKQLLDLDEPTIVSLRDRGKSEMKYCE